MMRYLSPLLFFFAFVAYAATDSDTFNVTLTVDEDTTAPTVPANLTATAISTSQIDLSWDASSDLLGVTGYQVFRGGVQIATSTGTTYSDTGLAAGTLYTYTVTAFDAALNVSSSSPPASATTLSPESSTGGVSGSTGLFVTSIEVVPGVDFAVVNWQTSVYARSTLRWGLTPSYELGVITEDSFSREHGTTILGLSPFTRYYFSIEGETGFGYSRVLVEDEFRTLPRYATGPENVFDLSARKDGDDIVLDWQNPIDEQFDRVRAVRSDLFYPADPEDGVFVYEGDGETVRDVGAAVPGTTQFYTLFSYDKEGNVSSGAVVALRISAEGEVVPVTPDVFPKGAEEFPLNLDDIQFYQDGMELSVADGVVQIDGGKHLQIVLPYEAVPEELKSILITIYNDEAENFSFLLRVNEEKTAYTATVAPLGISGSFPFTATVFDFGQKRVATAEGTLVANVISAAPEEMRRDYLPYFILFLIALLMLAGLLFAKGRRRCKGV